MSNLGNRTKKGIYVALPSRDEKLLQEFNRVRKLKETLLDSYVKLMEKIYDMYPDFYPDMDVDAWLENGKGEEPLTPEYEALATFTDSFEAVEEKLFKRYVSIHEAQNCLEDLRIKVSKKRKHKKL